MRRDVPLGHPEFGRDLRCQACCEGNQVSDVKERREIARYLVGYQPEERHEREAARRQGAADAYADYVARNGDPRARLVRKPRLHPLVVDADPPDAGEDGDVTGDEHD